MRYIVPILCLLFASPALAQECRAWSTMVEQLNSQYGEVRILRAMESSGTPIMIFLNGETGTWTIVRIRPPNCAVILDDGYGMEPTWLRPPGEPT